MSEKNEEKCHCAESHRLKLQLASLQSRVGVLEGILTSIGDIERKCECGDSEINPDNNNCVHCLVEEALSTQAEGEKISDIKEGGK